MEEIARQFKEEYTELLSRYKDKLTNPQIMSVLQSVTKKQIGFKDNPERFLSVINYLKNTGRYNPKCQYIEMYYMKNTDNYKSDSEPIDYTEKARDIVWANIDCNKLIDNSDLEKSVTGIVTELLKTIGELDERVTSLERRQQNG